jgi:thiol-disulfide isomerase/thioredoxin
MVLTLPDSFQVDRPSPPALIVVGTEWCGFCAQFKPELKELERKLAGRVRVYWVDGDASPERVREWNVDGFPTVLYKPTTPGRMVKYPDDASRTASAIHSFVTKFDPMAVAKNMS